MVKGIGDIELVVPATTHRYDILSGE
jgi:hypothetical protein